MKQFLNRELQWLAFNERVLQQAIDERTPLLERVRFLAIFSNNLDEFIMKRVGGLRRQLAAQVLETADGLSPLKTLDVIRSRVLELTAREAQCFREQIHPALTAAGIELVTYDELTPEEVDAVSAWYRAHVFPILTPLAVDSGHRFPFISNLSISLGVLMRREGEKEPLFARVKVPEVVDPWYRIPVTGRYVSLVEVMEHNVKDLFPGMEIGKVLPFRITRNADIEGEHEDAEDLLDAIEQQVRERRFAAVVRMQIARSPSKRLLELLRDAMELRDEDIYETRGLLDYGSLHQIAKIPEPDLIFKPWSPVVPVPLAKEGSIFTAIRRKDILVHHPYESFDASVERFVREAARDPQVVAIKQSLYRTSGDSPFIHELIRAAEQGKQVAVMVELQARFDESRNIYWARKLEDAGVHVAYGVVGLKTHTKTTLVVRREEGGLRCYAHIGSGNYHSETARLYEDVGLLTARESITSDIVHLFNFITGRSQHDAFEKLLVAPHNMKSRFIELIEAEITHKNAGRPAGITAKLNQLQDRDIIGALYRASQADVPIRLVVRGFCTLRPGVPGLSENISVVSIIGRFLEHSRIFHFRCGQEDPLDGEFLIGSADWMHRNLEARVEAVTPILRRGNRRRLLEVLEMSVADRRLAWDMQSDGAYIQRMPDGLDAEAPEAIGVHQSLMNMAQRDAVAALSEFDSDPRDLEDV